MGDEDQREVTAALQVHEDGENLSAHRGVEHRDRLVADQALGLEHERGGDRHALALAARKLVRVAVEESLGVRPTSSIARRTRASCSSFGTPWTTSGSVTIAFTRWRGFSVW